MKRKERIKKAKQKQLEVCQRLKKKQSPSDEPNPLCNIKGDTTFAWQEAHEDSTKNTMSYDSNQENNLLVEDDEGNIISPRINYTSQVQYGGGSFNKFPLPLYFTWAIKY